MTTSANVTLEWSVNMNTLLNLNDYFISNIHPMPQERVAILMLDSNWSV